MALFASPDVSPADPGLSDAVAHYRNRLAFETDVSDVAAALGEGVPGLVVVDSRSREAWNQGHLPGAVHCPTAEIAARGPELFAGARLVVTYCWGPGCNGATRAALAVALLGVPVKEMLGGYEYWVREGFAVETDHGTHQQLADPLTVVGAATCGC